MEMPLKNSTHQLPVSLQQITCFTAALPLIGFTFCIVWSFVYDFENSTYTHCDVNNFAPSISTAIGSFVPQKYVWQTCIAFHSAPRLLLVAIYKHLYKQRLNLTRRARIVVYINLILAAAENLSLQGLSIVSSRELFSVHKVFFATFLFSALGYMLTSNILFRRCGFVPQNKTELTSLSLKKTILRINVCLTPLLILLYYWHNEHCQPYAYSWFCICEYIIVLSNVGFHTLAYYDFHDLAAVIPPRPVPPGYQPLKEIA